MLRITLKNGEKAIINGAVIQAVGRTQLCIENQAALLRGREVMNPEEADTVAKRLYFATMLAYIDQPNREQHQESILVLIAELLRIHTDTPMRAACIRFAEMLSVIDFYRALGIAREMIAIETEMLRQEAA